MHTRGVLLPTLPGAEHDERTRLFEQEGLALPKPVIDLKPSQTSTAIRDYP